MSKKINWAIIISNLGWMAFIAAISVALIKTEMPLPVQVILLICIALVILDVIDRFKMIFKTIK